ncbi:cell division protein FtsX [Hasllibacter halocynthiae]|nr:FtsX-like permease family protein [Hasllibacter halocynthiae]
MVPRTGAAATLTLGASAAMGFLAMFALALTFASGRLADRWSDGLAGTATVRIEAPRAQVEPQMRAALTVLRQTPGVAEVRALSAEERAALVAPWFGEDVPVADLPLPILIAVTEAVPGYDAEGLRLRLAAEAPGAVLDDHARWRGPLVAAARRLRLLGWLSMGIIALSSAAIVTLAANAALAANARVIEVLRLNGARDDYVARAFVRRFTLRAFIGAAGGTALGAMAIALLPSADAAGGFLTGLGFRGAGWLWPLLIPPVAGAVAFAATRAAAMRQLRAVS